MRAKPDVRSTTGSGQETSQLRARAAFPKAARLLKTDEYSSVFRLRPWRRSPHFVLYGKPTGNEARLGLVIGKKFAPRAVTRNLIKRLAREAFRLAARGTWRLGYPAEAAREDRPQGHAEREIAAASDVVPRRDRQAARPGGARSGAPTAMADAGAMPRRRTSTIHPSPPGHDAQRGIRFTVADPERIRKARSLCKRH